MPQTNHVENHFEAPDLIRDIVIGMSDGLTVPFALAAGLAGTIPTTKLIVIAGISEIVAGMIAMGLGGYLAGRHDREHYLAELDREHQEVMELSEKEKHEVEHILRDWGVQDDVLPSVVESITSDKDRWVDFMMKFELGLTEEPDPKRARNSSITIGLSYLFGGLIPLFPYMLISQAIGAQIFSIIITLIALFLFGFFKGKFSGTKPWYSAFQMMFIGGLAAAAAYIMARLV